MVVMRLHVLRQLITTNNIKFMAMTPEQKKVYDNATAAASKAASVATGGTYTPEAGYNPGKVAADPVIASSPVRRYTGEAPAGNTGSYESAASTYYEGTDKSQPDEAKIRETMMNNVQSQIDQIKSSYVGILANEKNRGENRSGQTRAINARSGVLGQDFGNAAAEKTNTLNDENMKAIEAERDLKIVGILSKVNADAEAKVQNEKNRAAKNSEDYLSYLKTSQESSRANALGLARAGMDVEKLTDDEYNKLIETTGFSPQELKDYFVLNKPADKELTSGTVGNRYYSVSQDPITGQKKTSYVELPFAVPEEYTTQKLDDGTVLFVPKKIDPTKKLDEQILSYGVHAKPVTPKSSTVKDVVSGTLTVPAADINEGIQKLNSSKNEGDEADGKYADPNLYQNMYNRWIDAGGKPQDFIKTYPPAAYINPANDTLPLYLRSNKSLKKTTGTGGGA